MQCKISRYARYILASVRFFMGVTRTALLSILTMTMMYLYPCCEWKGKRPFWSEYFLFLDSYALMEMSRSFFLWRFLALMVGSGMGLGFAEQTFWSDWFRVSVVSG